MNKVKNIILCCLLVLYLAVFGGCKKEAVSEGKVDESKAVSEIKAEAEKMDIEQLKAMAIKYKDAILAKKADVDKLLAESKQFTAAEMMSEKGNALMADIDKLDKSMQALNERFEVYRNKAKELGADVSDIEK